MRGEPWEDCHDLVQPTMSVAPGAVLPTVAVCLVGLMGFIALAIDIGLMVAARSQCQNAADSAALAGARAPRRQERRQQCASRDGPRRVSAARSNLILNGPITRGPGDQRGRRGSTGTIPRRNAFQAVFGQAPGPNEAYGAMQVTLASQQPTIFRQCLLACNLWQSAAVATGRATGHATWPSFWISQARWLTAVSLLYPGTLGWSAGDRLAQSRPHLPSLRAMVDFRRSGHGSWIQPIPALRRPVSILTFPPRPQCSVCSHLSIGTVRHMHRTT